MRTINIVILSPHVEFALIATAKLELDISKVSGWDDNLVMLLLLLFLLLSKLFDCIPPPDFH